ncbi:MAG: sterol desaturase, partial [Bacteroidota bacterium]
KGLVNWSWMHLVVANVLLYFMLYQVSQGVDLNIPVYGTLIFVSIYGYTALMDRDKYAVWVESIRGFFGFGWILYTGDWFGLNEIFFPATVLVAIYFAASALGALYFHRKEIVQKEELEPVLVSNN